jgi:hypothetical protein
MKNTFILLAAFCLFSVSLPGQNKGQRVDLLREAANKHLIAKSLIDNALPVSSSGDLKSMSEIKQKLDFIIYEGLDDSTGAFVTWYKNEYRYDTFGRPTEAIWWQCDQDPCKPDYKDVTSYDSNGNKSLLSSSWWDSISNNWIMSWKEERFYNSGNDIIRSLDSYLNDSTNVWMTSWKTEYNYDAEKNLIMKTDFDWDANNSIWTNSYRSEYEYDHGNPVRILNSSWNDSLATWVNSFKTELTYNVSGKETMQVGSIWDEETSQWVPVSKEEITYNANGKVSMDVTSEWDFEKGIWAVAWKDEYTWDGSGNMVESVGSYGTDSTGNWMDQYKTFYTYNNSFTFADLLLPDNFFPTDFFNHMLLGLTGLFLDDSTNQWVEEQHMIFQYSEMNIGGIPGVAISDIKVFPNPVADIIRIESDIPMVSAIFELNDIQGRRVLSENLNGARKYISLKSLPSGVYFYQIINKGETHRGKIIVR